MSVVWDEPAIVEKAVITFWNLSNLYGNFHPFNGILGVNREKIYLKIYVLKYFLYVSYKKPTE